MVSTEVLPARNRRIPFGTHKGKSLRSLPSAYLSRIANTLRKWAQLAEEVLHERCKDHPPPNVGLPVEDQELIPDEKPACQNVESDWGTYIQTRLNQPETRVSSDTYASLLRYCGNGKGLLDGMRVHKHIIKSGLERDAFLGSIIVQMYAKCGAMEDAHGWFVQMHERNAFSWNFLIGAYAELGQSTKTCALFEQMQQDGVAPDRVTFLHMLSACASQVALEEGKATHGHIKKVGFESDVVVATALLHMYGKCGSLEDAQKMFDKMPERNSISWNAIIAAHARQGHGEKAFQLFEQMQQEGVISGKVSFLSILDACDRRSALAGGKRIHTRILYGGFISDAVVATALVDMYGKCGSVEDARSIFDRLSKRDVVSWNAMIGGYARHGHGKDSLRLFDQMRKEGVVPSKATFISVLDACGAQAAIAKGKWIHKLIVQKGFQTDVILATALVNMYSKCGNLKVARSVFNKMSEHDVVSWNAMLAAYARHGWGKEALKLYDLMRREKTVPDSITFVNLLTACSHAGLVDEGRHFFHSIRRDHCITLVEEHYDCMIDLLGRAGCLDEAEALIQKMPFQPTIVTWTTLLGACRNQVDVKRGQRAAQRVFDLDPEYHAPYVMLSNIFTAAGMDSDAEKMVNRMKELGLKKQPGCSYIEVEGTVHEFFADDQLHPRKEEIYAELEGLNRQMKKAGYVPDTKLLLRSVEKGKKPKLSSHSEKLAIAFGLISTPPRSPLLVTKNLRVCQDCHSATKFISKITNRKIVVRDANRFHHIEDGICSCADYW